VAEAGSTWADLQQAVYDDMGQRDDLAQAIINALTKAVEFYQPKIFLATEAEAQWTSTNAWPGTPPFPNPLSNAQTVALPPNFESIDAVYCNITGDWVRLFKKSQGELEDENVAIPPPIGPPVDYSIFENLMWFYPYPDEAYPLKAIYDELIPLPAGDGTSNYWTTDAASMIQYYAQGLLRATTVRTQDNGVNDFALSKKEYYKLKQRVADVEAPRRARPVYL
jgi:hypothetical protein